MVKHRSSKPKLGVRFPLPLMFLKFFMAFNFSKKFYSTTNKSQNKNQSKPQSKPQSKNQSKPQSKNQSKNQSKDLKQHLPFGGKPQEHLTLKQQKQLQKCVTNVFAATPSSADRLVVVNINSVIEFYKTFSVEDKEFYDFITLRNTDIYVPRYSKTRIKRWAFVLEELRLLLKFKSYYYFPSGRDHISEQVYLNNLKHWSYFFFRFTKIKKNLQRLKFKNKLRNVIYTLRDVSKAIHSYNNTTPLFKHLIGFFVNFSSPKSDTVCQFVNKLYPYYYSMNGVLPLSQSSSFFKYSGAVNQNLNYLLNTYNIFDGPIHLNLYNNLILNNINGLDIYLRNYTIRLKTFKKLTTVLNIVNLNSLSTLESGLTVSKTPDHKQYSPRLPKNDFIYKSNREMLILYDQSIKPLLSLFPIDFFSKKANGYCEQSAYDNFIPVQKYKTAVSMRRQSISKIDWFSLDSLLIFNTIQLFSLSFITNCSTDLGSRFGYFYLFKSFHIDERNIYWLNILSSKGLKGITSRRFRNNVKNFRRFFFLNTNQISALQMLDNKRITFGTPFDTVNSKLRQRFQLLYAESPFFKNLFFRRHFIKNSYISARIRVERDNVKWFKYFKINDLLFYNFNWSKTHILNFLDSPERTSETQLPVALTSRFIDNAMPGNLKFHLRKMFDRGAARNSSAFSWLQLPNCPQQYSNQESKFNNLKSKDGLKKTLITIYSQVQISTPDSTHVHSLFWKRYTSALGYISSNDSTWKKNKYWRVNPNTITPSLSDFKNQKPELLFYKLKKRIHLWLTSGVSKKFIPGYTSRQNEITSKYLFKSFDVPVNYVKVSNRWNHFNLNKVCDFSNKKFTGMTHPSSPFKWFNIFQLAPSSFVSNLPSSFWYARYLNKKTAYYASVGFPLDATKFHPVDFSYPSVYFTNVTKRLFEFQFNAKVSLIINSDYLKLIQLREISFLKYITLRLQTYAFQFSTIFFLSEFIDIVYLGLKKKSLSIMLSYIQRILNKLIIWDHKKFFVFLYELFSEHFFYFFESMNISGMFIMLRGKIGVAGNSRKRVMYLKLGSVSKIQPLRSVQTLNTLLGTTTGALGLQISIYYKN